MMDTMLFNYLLAHIVVGFILAPLSIFVLMQNVKSRLYQTFALYNLALSWWCFFSIPALITYDSQYTGAFWCRIFVGGLIWIPPFFFHFNCLLSDNEKKLKKIIFVNYLVTAIIFVFNIFTNLLVKTAAPKFSLRSFTVPGPLFHIHMTQFLIFMFFSAYLLIKKYSLQKTLEFKNVLYYCIFSLLAVIFAGCHYFLVYNIEIPILNPFGIYSLALYGMVVAYIILRYNFLNIEVIIKKTLVFAGVFASVFAIFVLPTLIIHEFIVSQMGLGGRIAGLSISAILIVLILKPLENFLINITDKYLFQKKYDYKELLKTFTGEVLTVLDLSKLTRLTVYKLSDIIKLVSCGVLLLDEEKGGYRLTASYGIREKDIFMKRENTLATFMERTRAYLSIRQQGKESPIPKNILKDMNTLKVELAIPLILHNKMIGILTLGKKKSDETYNQDDIDILLPLTKTLAIAISNARLFDELSKTQAEAAQREKMAVVGTLSAGINHEICNPLGIVRGQCEAFMLNLKDGFYKNKTEKELLDKAINIMNKTMKEVDRATAVTRRLSGFATPVKEIMLEEVKVKDEIEEVMALVGHELKLEKIDVVKEIPDDLPNISADRKQIEEIFFNLIRNAGQAIGEKGRITIRAREDEDNKVLIEIEDTGHGIPEDKLDQIFNPFYTTKDPGKGTGLGLFIVRQVIEKNRGKISVKSKVGVGTTFTLEFPTVVKEKVA